MTTECDREMTLAEWVNKLPKFHRANKDFENLIECVRTFMRGAQGMVDSGDQDDAYINYCDAMDSLVSAIDKATRIGQP